MMMTVVGVVLLHIRASALIRESEQLQESEERQDGRRRSACGRICLCRRDIGKAEAISMSPCTCSFLQGSAAPSPT